MFDSPHVRFLVLIHTNTDKVGGVFVSEMSGVKG